MVVTAEVKPLLLVLTASYPFSVATERTFLEPEIRRYQGRFSRIVLVPQDTRGDRAPIPPGIEVDTSLAEELKAMQRLPLLVKGLLSRGFLRELWKYPWLIRTPVAVLRIAINRGRIERMVAWFKLFQLTANTERAFVIYSFWLDSAVLAAGLFRERGGRAMVVARAHGGDLYAERHSPAHIPFQGEAISLLDLVAPDSKTGADYLQKKYPKHAHKIEAALLGTDEPGFRSATSTDGVLRLVSCAFLVEVKRIDLLVKGIAELAKRNSDRRIEWVHFGGGPLMSSISSLADAVLPHNVHAVFKGNVETRAIYDWYREHPIDVFINVSRSEGTPVSIIEAISCSIPVIATSVGGNQEIVNDSLGKLISADPTVQEIAMAIESVCLQYHKNELLKQASYAQWSENYSAEKNFSAFGTILKKGF